MIIQDNVYSIRVYLQINDQIVHYHFLVKTRLIFKNNSGKKKGIVFITMYVI